MHATPKMQGQPVSKRRLVMQLMALFLFVIICGDLAAAKVMTFGGGYSQICKMAADGLRSFDFIEFYDFDA